MTADDLGALQTSTLHRRTPYIITPVLGTYFSVARHYGGITYQGERYNYHPDQDSLVRWDVDRWLLRKQAAQRATAHNQATLAQLTLEGPQL